MSIALRFLHEHPTFSTNVVVGGQNVVERFRITMETETPDALARVWQAINARVSAHFIPSYHALVEEMGKKPQA